MNKPLHKICNKHLMQSECEHYRDAMEMIKELKEALSFYADEDNYINGQCIADKGSKARKILVLINE